MQRGATVVDPNGIACTVVDVSEHAAGLKVVVSYDETGSESLWRYDELSEVEQ